MPHGQVVNVRGGHLAVTLSAQRVGRLLGMTWLRVWFGRRSNMHEQRDNEALQRAAARQLIQAGALPVTAGTPKSARLLLAAGHVDAAVVDIELPDGSGWDLIEDLREDASSAFLPIVVCTALPDDITTLGRAAALDCEYLGKPSTGSALLSRINRARETVAKSRWHDCQI